MKLELNAEEVKDVLLEWARGKWGNTTFNTVDFDSSYGAFRKAEFSYEPPAPAGPEAIQETP